MGNTLETRGLPRAILLFWILILLIPLPLPADDTEPGHHADRPKIGLALSGGGARGCAHVGVLKVLEANNIPVDYIAGTSMGAVIGGLYAAGLDAERIEELFVATDWTDMMLDEPPGTRNRSGARRRTGSTSSTSRWGSRGCA